MNYISVTRIGKQLGLSYQQIHKVLSENELFEMATLTPTESAYENKLVRTRTAVSKYSGNLVDFYLWDFDKLESLLTNAQKQENMIRFRSSEDAFNKILWAFMVLGDMVQINTELQNNNISEDANYSVVQACYGEADHLRGLVLLHRHFHPHEAEEARTATMTLANELYTSAIQIDESKAKTNLFVIERALSWLCENVQ